MAMTNSYHNNYCITHLHTTKGSVGDSIATNEDIVEKAKQLGMNSIAITDHGSLGNMYGFYYECINNDIKPIIGCCLPEQIIYTSDGPKQIKDIKPGDYVLTHKGRYRKVLNHWSKPFDGILYGLDCYNNNIVWLTDEHPVLVKHIDQNKNKTGIIVEESKWLKPLEINMDNPKFIKEFKDKNGNRKTKTYWSNYCALPKHKNTTLKNINIIDYIPNDMFYVKDNTILKKKKNKYESDKTKYVIKNDHGQVS